MTSPHERQSRAGPKERSHDETAPAFRFRPGTVQGPASVQLYADLRDRIVRLELPPDTTLDRSELATGYQVSQTPVREAIMRLEQDGLVKSFPQSRTVVTRIDVARIREEHFLRLAVECEVVLQLAAKADNAVLTKLNGLLRLQEALVDDVEQAALFKQLDEAFHEALFEGVGQVNLYRFIVARSGHMARVRTLDLPKQGKMRKVLEGHRSIVAAVATGDPSEQQVPNPPILDTQLLPTQADRFSPLPVPEFPAHSRNPAIHLLWTPENQKDYVPSNSPQRTRLALVATSRRDLKQRPNQQRHPD